MRRFLLWIGRLFLLSLVLGLVGGYLFANCYYNDEALGRRISEGFNKTHRGRLEIRRIHWKSSVLMALARQGYDDVEVHDLRIYDSRGEEAIHVPYATGRIRLWDIILHGDFFLERLKFTRARVRLERYERPDGPSPRGEPDEIGLIGAFEKRPRPADEAKKEGPSKAPRQSFIVVDRFELSGIQVLASLGEERLTLEDLKVGGRLRFASAAGRKPEELSFDLKPAATRGKAELGKRSFALTDLVVRRLATTPDIGEGLVVDAALGVDGARLALGGGLKGIGSAEGAVVAMKGEARGIGGLLAKLTGRAVRDEGSRLLVEASGPLSQLVAELGVEGLGLDEDPVQAKGINAQASYDRGLLTVRRMSAELLGGRLTGRASLCHGSGSWQATLLADRLSTGPLLGEGQEDLRGRLSGWLDAAGALEDPSQGWTRFDLRLERDAQRGPLPPSVRAHGDLHGSKERLDIRRLAVESDLLSVDTHGRFWPGKQEMDLALTAEAQRLRAFLLRLGKPPMVAALSLNGRARGRVMNPQFTGQGTLYGVQSSGVSLGSLGAGLSLRDGTLSADGVRGRLFGGSLTGQARVDLYKGDLRQMRPEPLIYARGGVAGLDLEPATKGAVEALVQGSFLVRGTPAFLRGRVQARSPLLWSGGHWYRDAALDLGFVGPRFEVSSLGVLREDGGHAKASGRFSTGPRGKVDLRIDVSRLPLAALPGLDRPEGKGPAPVSGEVETSGLRVLGTFAEPVLEGTVKLLGAAIRGVPAGDGELRLQPEEQHTALSGDLLSFLRVATGRLDLGRQKGVALKVRFTDVPVEKYVPELARHGNAEGKMSGTLDLEVGAPGGIRLAKLTVDKLALRLEKPEDPYDDLPGEVAELRNRGPILMHWEKGRLV
ncbi:MAG: hypothetical protein RBU30_15330, partial [Polyangia bacterium]|nr:hypothetical protein [Polyangia bacterium]